MYKDLRTVHKKLESDLRQAQITSELPFDDSNRMLDAKQSNDEQISGRMKSGNMHFSENSVHEAGVQAGSQSNSRSMRLSYQESGRDSVSQAGDNQYEFKLMDSVAKPDGIELRRRGGEFGKRRADRKDKHDGRRRYE